MNCIRIIGAKGLSHVHDWIDASHGVHTDVKGHTGGAISMGHVVVHSRAGNQKTNTKSSA